MLRKCEQCGADLPAGATVRAKYCGARCRQRAYHDRKRGVPAAGRRILVVAELPAESPSGEDSRSRLERLEAAAIRLDRLLDIADPRTAAALNKEYRDTLQQLEALRDAQADSVTHGKQDYHERRPFQLTAI